jgi:hypothetical protein
MALDERSKKFAHHRARGVGRVQSALLAGYDGDKDNAGRVEERPEVAAEIKKLQTETAENVKVTKEMVAAGLLRAADLAQTMADPGAMVTAWRELGKMLGFYAPEVKKVEKSINKADLKAALQDLSDEDLLQLANGRVVDGQVTGKEVALLPDMSKKLA